MKKRILKSQNAILFSINPKVYSLEAIYGASYVFVDRAYLFLDGDPKREIQVRIKGKKKMSQKKLESLVGEFSNELLNYALRQKIAKANKKIREYVVGKALYYSTGEIFEESADEADQLQEDPLSIAVPWEEKYGEDKTE